MTKRRTPPLFGPPAGCKAPCRCRGPRRHDGCMYCGYYWAGDVVCGVCKEAGIDGKVIRGTSRVVCARHKSK